MLARKEFEKATQFYNSGNYKKALELYSGLLIYSSKLYFESKLMVAQCQLYLGKFDNALEGFNGLLNSETKQRAELGISMCRIFSGNFSELKLKFVCSDPKVKIFNSFIASIVYNDVNQYVQLCSFKSQFNSAADEYFILLHFLNTCFLANNSIFNHSCNTHELLLLEEWKTQKISNKDITTLSVITYLSAIAYERFNKPNLTQSSLQSIENFNKSFVPCHGMCDRYRKFNQVTNSSIKVDQSFSFNDPFITSRIQSDILGISELFKPSTTNRESSLQPNQVAMSNSSKSGATVLNNSEVLFDALPPRNTAEFNEFPRANY